MPCTLFTCFWTRPYPLSAENRVCSSLHKSTLMFWTPAFRNLSLGHLYLYCGPPQCQHLTSLLVLSLFAPRDALPLPCTKASPSPSGSHARYSFDWCSSISLGRLRTCTQGLHVLSKLNLHSWSGSGQFRIPSNNSCHVIITYPIKKMRSEIFTLGVFLVKCATRSITGCGTGSLVRRRRLMSFPVMRLKK